MYFIKGGGGHGHDPEAGHGHSHKGEAGQENINVKAAFIHVVGDFLQSLGKSSIRTNLYLCIFRKIFSTSRIFSCSIFKIFFQQSLLNRKNNLLP